MSTWCFGDDVGCGVVVGLLPGDGQTDVGRMTIYEIVSHHAHEMSFSTLPSRQSRTFSATRQKTKDEFLLRHPLSMMQQIRVVLMTNTNESKSAFCGHASDQL